MIKQVDDKQRLVFDIMDADYGEYFSAALDAMVSPDVLKKQSVIDVR